MTLRVAKLGIFVKLGLFTLGGALLAKGADQLTPEVPATDLIDTPKPSPEVQPENESKEGEPSPSPSVSPGPEGADPSPAPTPEESPAPEPSELSKSLADKAYLGSGLNFTKFKSSKGSWASSGHGAILLGYEFYQLGTLNKIFATAEYAPKNFIYSSAARQYWGVAHHFLGGIKWQRELASKLRFYVTGELGVVGFSQTSADSISGIGAGDKLSAGALGGFNLGIDWILVEKLGIGPRLGLHAGALSGYYLGGQLTFHL